jgi:uncharacterized protein (DUF2249 family)
MGKWVVMAPVEENQAPGSLLESAEHAISSADWAAFRSVIAALHEQLLPRYASNDERDERVREILGALIAVSPAHDPEGCRNELAALAEILRVKPGTTPQARALPPLVDLRGLPPPQPVAQILEALDNAPDAPLRVVLPHEPHPLYDLLRRRGFSWSGAPHASGGYELTIRKT